MPCRKIAIGALLLVGNTESFIIGIPNSVVESSSSSSYVRLQMAGRGMGMGVASSSQRTNKRSKKGLGSGSGNKSKKKKGMGGGGGGSNKKSVPTFDVNASMLRLEKRYEEIMKLSAKSLLKEEEKEKEDPRWASNNDDDDNESSMTTEYVITARADTKQIAVRDWVPIAQLCVQRPENEYENTKEILQEAISSYCRELSYVASYGAPVFSTVARNVVQYGIEPIDSFYKHVYDNVVETGSSDNSNPTMTKSEAKNVLGLTDVETLDKSVVKQAYRKLSFTLHPDRIQNEDDDSKKKSAKLYAEVQLAFETLSSGIREEGSSWYQSLGGKARTDFLGPVNLLPLGAAQAQMERRGIEAAILGLEPDLVQSFVARNLGSQ